MDMIQIVDNGALLSPEATIAIAEIEQKMQELKKKEDDMKKAILEEMEAKGVIKLENEQMVITYIGPTDREIFDSKKFRADNPDLYDEYIQMSPVKSSIRIKLR